MKKTMSEFSTAKEQDFSTIDGYTTYKKNGCWQWNGYYKRKRQPLFYSRSEGVLHGVKYKEVNVRRFMAGLLDSKASPRLRTTCLNYKCINPTHIINYGRRQKIFPKETETTLRHLMTAYPLTYLSEYYKISRFLLRRCRDG